MKTIICLYIFTLLSISMVQAQYDPVPGSYITNNNMTAFHGTWQWSNGTDTIRVYLTTKKALVINYYADLLVGWHLYKRNNTIIESSYGDINILDKRTISLHNDGVAGNREVSGTLIDLTKNGKFGHLTLVLNAAQNQFTWKLENTEGLYINKPGQPPFDYGFTLPKNLVFVKL